MQDHLRLGNSFTAGLLALAATFCVNGQTTSLSGNIPFEFTLGKNALPPGVYHFSAVPGTPWLAAADDKHRTTKVGIITRLADNLAIRDASLVFDIVENRHVLSEVWIPGEGGLLVNATPKGHTHETVIAVLSGAPANGSGKQIFSHTCERCHGPEGRGNPAADKFFQTQLPRLNSVYVQSKSDAELKEIVMHGRRKMDPVRTGQASVQHLLPPDSVDAVLAYVRTFKQK
jgi:mono/diheme cytochrome c family protein